MFKAINIAKALKILIKLAAVEHTGPATMVVARYAPWKSWIIPEQ
jgi:hypothetical protein